MANFNTIDELERFVKSLGIPNLASVGAAIKSNPRARAVFENTTFLGNPIIPRAQQQVSFAETPGAVTGGPVPVGQPITFEDPLGVLEAPGFGQAAGIREELFTPRPESIPTKGAGGAPLVPTALAEEARGIDTISGATGMPTERVPTPLEVGGVTHVGDPLREAFSGRAVGKGIGLSLLGTGIGQLQEGTLSSSKLESLGGLATTIGGIMSLAGAGGIAGPGLAIVGTLLNMQGQTEAARTQQKRVKAFAGAFGRALTGLKSVEG